MLKLPIFILLWLGFLLIKIPTALLGLIMVPAIYRFRFTGYENLPWWTRPWANPEDWEGNGNGSGSLPLWWVNAHGVNFKSFFQYHAIRNPANGLRSFEWIDMDIDPARVEYRRSHAIVNFEPGNLRRLKIKTAWYIAWQGYQAGFQVYHIWSDDRHLNIKFGWRVDPSDADTSLPKNMGVDDASFATKFLLYRRG